MKFIIYNPKVILFVVFLMCFMNCNDQSEPVPYTPVNFNIYIHDAEYSNLQVIYGFEYVTGGYNNNGIIVFRMSETEFMAVDRTCPHDPVTGVVNIDEDFGVIAVDSVCGSKFMLTTRSIMEGPASRFLTEYNTSFNPTTGMLYVYN